MILNFRTDRSGLEEQSDQGLHCLLFHLHVKIPSGLASLFEFQVNKYSKVSCIQKFTEIYGNVNADSSADSFFSK